MKKGIRKVLWAGCVLGFGVCIGVLSAYYIGLQKNKKVYSDMQTRVLVQEETTETALETESKEKPDIPVDFEELWHVNPEIYAWIQIPETEVNYPIVQSLTDNSYYLNHTIEGVAGYPGSIYTEGVNSKDFKDFNTVIYGHDMEDGSMFGGLYRYLEEDYLKTHETLMIYTPEHRLTYRIFEAVIYDDRHIIGSFDFNILSEREAYLESIGNTEDEVTGESHIITLSTCVASQPDKRLLVEAVLVHEE